MRDLDVLLLILFALYVVECLCWAPESAQVFRRSRPGWQLSNTLITLTVLKKSLHFSSLIPGSGSIVLSQGAPPCLALAGFLSEHSGACPNEAENIQAEGIGVKHGSLAIFQAGTAGYAAFLANFIRQFVLMSAEQRPQRIRQEFDRLLNVSAAKRRFALYKRLEQFLTLDCTLLVVLVLVAFPTVAYLRTPLSAWPIGIAALLFLIRILWLFGRIHRLLYPGRNSERRTHIAEMALMPLAAMRAPDRLSRELFSEFHWLAVAPVVCNLELARSLAERALRHLEYTAADELAESSPAEWLHREWREAVRRYVCREFGDPQLLLMPPPRRFSETVSYCPRCCEEYVLMDGFCRDCSGVPLRCFQGPVT